MKYSREGPLRAQSFIKVSIAAGLLYYSLSNMEAMKHKEEKSNTLEPICIEPRALEVICTGIAPLLAGIAMAAYSAIDPIVQTVLLSWDVYDMIAGAVEHTHVD